MKKYLLLLILILCLTFPIIGYSAWLAGWDYRIELSIGDYANDIGGSVTWFPVTFFLTSTQAEEVFAELVTDAEYLKVAFTKADGTTELYAEKELFAHDYTSQYPPAHSDTYVKATTKYDTNQWAYYTTDPTKSLTGADTGNQWISVNGTYTNQRFHIDLGSAKVIRRIYYENNHATGANSIFGVQNFTFWGSNTGVGTFDDLVYANDEGWTELTVSQNAFDQHIAANQADPKYIIVTNSTSYRYYAFKFADNFAGFDYMGIRRIELQTEDPLAIYHVSRDGWTIDANTSIYMYYDKDHLDNTTYIGAINTTPGAAVWDGNFKAVYHMVDDNGNVDDSTSNDNDGTKKGANEPNEVTGKVGQAQDFDGSNDFINCQGLDSLDIINAITISTWVKKDDAGGNYLLLMRRIIGEHATFGVELLANGKIVFVFESAGWHEPFSAGTINADWHHIAITYDESNVRFYIDGALDDTVAETAVLEDHEGNLYLGKRAYPAEEKWFAGLNDELYISNTKRSDAWIQGIFNSGNDSLFTYGSEETEVVAEEENALFFGANF